MIMTSGRRVLSLLSGLAAGIALTVAGIGLLDVNIYRSVTAAALIPGTVSQDILSVVAALGVFLCLAAVRRGRDRAWLVWLGLMTYLLYAYALYSFERLVNPLFLGYVAVAGLSIYALIVFFRFADLQAVAFSARRKAPPRNTVAALLLLLVAMFVFLWLRTLIPAMRVRIPPEASSILVMDLSFFLPLLAIEAALLFRKHALGDVLAIPLLIKAGTLGISVLLGTLLFPWFGMDLDLTSVGIYALLGLGPLVLVIPYWRTLQMDSSRTPGR